MDSEKLIEVVASYPCSYDQSRPKCIDGNGKEKVWKMISDQVQQPGSKSVLIFYDVFYFTTYSSLISSLP